MKFEFFPLIGLAILMGIVIPYQSQVNARLGAALGAPLLGTFVNFLVGLTVISIVIWANKVPFPEVAVIRGVPPLYFVGGLMGVLFVTASLYLVPKIGAINLFSCLIAGQIVSSIVMDYFGLFSDVSKTISRDKWIGLGLLIVGIIMIIKER